ncbi:arylsulfatase regulator [Ensifer sp. MPMI2T]|nr:arylsulfatase regulator [Ensifer sp. MPMI2T]
MLTVMRRLDTGADAMLLTGADDISLFVGIAEVMPDCQALLESPYRQEIETTGVRFPAFYRLATVLSKIAGGFADRSIKVRANGTLAGN